MEVENPMASPIKENDHFGTDACGEEIITGDTVLEYDGELVLETNAADFLIKILGAKRKVAGLDE
ncbi:MAG: YqaI family protein [Bacillota bacterium]